MSLWYGAARGGGEASLSSQIMNINLIGRLPLLRSGLFFVSHVNGLILKGRDWPEIPFHLSGDEDFFVLVIDTRIVGLPSKKIETFVPTKTHLAHHRQMSDGVR